MNEIEQKEVMKGDLRSYCGSLKEVEDEGDGTAVDANKEVDA